MKTITISFILILIFTIAIVYIIGWRNGFNKAHNKYFHFYDRWRNKYTNNK